MDTNYSLTPKQQRVFARLEKAVRACQAANIFLWDDYGTLSAVNGEIVNDIIPAVKGFADELEPLNEGLVSRVIGAYFHHNADDPLYVEFRR